MEKFKYILIKSSIILATTLSLVVLYLSFTSFTEIINYCNGFFSIALITILIGGLAWVSSAGGFDGLGYSTYYVFRGNRSETSERKYKSYFDYIEQKKIERRGKFYTITP